MPTSKRGIFMNKTMLAGIAACLLIAPVAAQAQTCSNLRSQLSSTRNAASSLAADNPGSAIVFGGCVVTAANEYDRRRNMSDAIATLTACATMGCVLTGDWGNCISVNTTLFIQSLRITDLQQQVRAGDC